MSDESRNPHSSAPPSREIRQQDLVELGHHFLRAAAPVTSVVDHMRIQNGHMEIQIGTSQRIIASLTRVVSSLRLLVVVASISLVMQIVAIYEVQKTADKISSASARIVEVERKTASLVEDVVSLRSETKETKEIVREQTEGTGTVYIVPEQDPIKARRAPIKVVVSPAKSSSGSGQPVAEIPISTEAAKGVTLQPPPDAGKSKR